MENEASGSVGRRHKGTTVPAGIYEAAVSIQDDKTLPFFLAANAIVHLYLQKKCNPALYRIALTSAKQNPLFICAKKK